MARRLHTLSLPVNISSGGRAGVGREAPVYEKIYVPLDNSDHSNAAIEVAIALARGTGARLVGSHVYAARMHDVRFKQMEYTLPEEYQHEQELERQRKIHDSLITRGLQLISDSYLDVMKAACDRADLPFEYKMFNGIVDVLSAEASKIFRFKEQEQLHEEIIDTGLAKIYESHLRVAQSVARDVGVELKTTLLDGKAFKKVLQYVRQDPPWLLIVGRIGVHSAAEMDMGSNSDNLLRLAPVSVLLSSRTFVPPVDVQAEASVTWTEEAVARMEKVPAAFRAITRTAICRYAMERGHSIISSSIIDLAVSEVMPEHAARAMGVEPAGAKATMDGDESTATWICRRCGRPARVEKPQECPVCAGTSFQPVDKAAVAAAATR